jgi:hypothetical protein
MRRTRPKRPSLPGNARPRARHWPRRLFPMTTLHLDAPEGCATFRDKAGMVILMILLVLACILCGCATRNIARTVTTTHPDGRVVTTETRYSSVRIRDDAPEVVGDLLNTASSLLPPWAIPTATAAIAALGIGGGASVLNRRRERRKAAQQQQREDQLYDEALEIGRNTPKWMAPEQPLSPRSTR